MKVIRQVEAVESMIASNAIIVVHVDALLKASLPECADFKPADLDGCLALIEQIVKLEKAMSRFRTQYNDAEENCGSGSLSFVVAKGCLTKFRGYDAVKNYTSCHEPEIPGYFELVGNTVCMEEAMRQRLGADGEFEGLPEGDAPDQKGAE